MSLLLVLSLGGCDVVQSLLNNPEAAIADADGKLKAGDLAGAATAFDEAGFYIQRHQKRRRPAHLAGFSRLLLTNEPRILGVELRVPALHGRDLRGDHPDHRGAQRFRG